MDHLHTIIDTPDRIRPGNQVNTDSFLAARNHEVQAMLDEISKLFDFYDGRFL